MLSQTKTAEPSSVNGINLDDLFALIEGVKRDAAKGKTNWRVTTSWQGQARSRTKIESFGMGGEQIPRRFSIDIVAQRLHDGLIRSAVRRARDHSRKPGD